MKFAWKQIVASFLLGAALTAVLTYACPAHRRGWGGSAHFQERMLKRFDQKLNLTPEQQPKFDQMSADWEKRAGKSISPNRKWNS